MSREVPAFAGIRVDPAAKQFVIQVTDGSMESARKALEAIESRFGYRQDVDKRNYRDEPRVETVRYSYLQLWEWYGPAQHYIFAAMEFRSGSIDIRSNRLHFGVADPEQNRACVDEEFARIGIPEDAYSIEFEEMETLE